MQNNTDQHKHKYDLLNRVTDENGFIRLTWATTGPSSGYINLGDALSPVIVSALSGQQCVHTSRNSIYERIVAVGTIGQEQRGGRPHIWGTCFDGEINAHDDKIKFYTLPPDTELEIHALRGRISAEVLSAAGINSPEIYGDPVWFLPSIFPGQSSKKFDLGVIPHLSEIDGQTVESGPRKDIIRYEISQKYDSTIKLINMWAPSNIFGVRDKIDLITSCKCIATTSLHGAVIAEAYAIPCIYLSPLEGGAERISVFDNKKSVNHRIRDFYSGLGLDFINVYRQPRAKQTDWDRLIDAINLHRNLHNFNPDSFLDSYPLPLKFDPRKGQFHDIRFFDKMML